MKGGYTGNVFLVLDVYLNEKEPSAKIQLLNIFKDYHDVAKLSVTIVDYDE